MKPMQGMDFSWSRPPIGQVDYVFRYIGDSGACLSAGEVASIHAAGKAIAPNFEQSANEATTGPANGARDANYANDHMDALGCPHDVAIWYSCDTSASYDQVAPYYRAVAAVGRRPAAYYGPLGPGLRLRSEGVVKGVWCANAASWSGYDSWEHMVANARANADVLQYLTHPLANVDPSSYDYDEVLRPFPAWGATGTVNPTSTQEPEVNVIIPRKVASTVPGQFAFVFFDLAGKRLVGYNGVDFSPNSAFTVSHGFGVAAAQLVAGTSSSLEFCEVPDGNGVAIVDTSNGKSFSVAYTKVGADPYEQPGGVPAPVDVAALAAAVAAHLKVTAS